MLTGFFGAAILSFLLVPLVPKNLTPEERHTVGMSLVYIGFALLPLIGVFAPLVLGLMGKLPGTKKN